MGGEGKGGDTMEGGEHEEPSLFMESNPVEMGQPVEIIHLKGIITQFFGE